MDVAACRQHFAALRCGARVRGARERERALTPRAPSLRSAGDASAWAFLENAGGSRVPDCVADAAAAYMRERYVQARAHPCPSRC